MDRNIKRGYFAFLWHGFFLAITMAMLDLNTVFPTLINVLTKSKFVFALLYSIMLGVPLFFNMIFGHFLKRAAYKKKFLLIGIYIRGLSFFGLAIFTYFFSLSMPTFTLLAFFLFVFLFSLSGGVAGLSYSDVLAKTIPSSHRTNVFTLKQVFGSTASLLGGFIIARIFSLGIEFPYNYTIGLFVGFIGLFIASIGFYFVKEPRGEVPEIKERFGDFIKKIPEKVNSSKPFKYFILTENLSAFSIMILPFYIIFAKEVLKFDETYIGIFLLVQISGTILSNILWGFIGKKYSAKSIVTICIILGGINPVIAILSAFTNSLLYFVVFFILGFTISGRKVGFEPYLLNITPSGERIEYLGIRGSLNLLIVILPLVGAFFIEFIGYYFTFALVTIVMVFSAYLFSKVNEELL
ncbi:MAG: MFS transporter [Bacilli bacterium]|nr:MFS transporter [Bacilli bacterium]